MGVVLRVGLDACDLVDDLVWFEEALLTGVGAEVASRDDEVLREGTVRLSEYRDGLRVGRWIEPGLTVDQHFLLHVSALDEAQYPDFDFEAEVDYQLDGQDLTSVLVFFDGPHVRGLEPIVNGSVWGTCLSVYWNADGGIHHYENWHVVPWGDRSDAGP